MRQHQQEPAILHQSVNADLPAVDKALDDHVICVRRGEGVIICLTHTGEIGYFGYPSAAGFVDDLEHDRQAELLGCPVNRPACTETTAMGAAYLAGLAAGVWNSTDEIKNIRTAEQIFMPGRVSEDTEKCLRGWHRAVERASRWAEEEQGMRLK